MSKSGPTVDYCPSEMIEQTMTLDPWAELAYRRICDLILISGGNLDDDDKKLAWSTRTGNRWRKVKQELLTAGKIAIEDGKIVTENSKKTIEKTRRNIRQKSEAGKASAEARKSMKNNDTGSTVVGTDVGTADITAVPTITRAGVSSLNLSYSESEIHEEEKNTFVPISDDVEKAFDAWNAVAAECGLPNVKRRTPERRRRLKARLRECGGLSGWVSALDRIRGSAFLRGDKGEWCADFDFVVQPKSFTKLVEGAYSRRSPRAVAPAQPRVSQRTAEITAMVEMFVKHGRWPEDEGPAPGLPGCRVPAVILQNFPSLLHSEAA
jgi:hypothetical protein